MRRGRGNGRNVGEKERERDCVKIKRKRKNYLECLKSDRKLYPVVNWNDQQWKRGGCWNSDQLTFETRVGGKLRGA